MYRPLYGGFLYGEMNEQAHRLLLEQRKTLSLGGVQDVKSFDENEVLLVTVCGVLTIRGKELHVGRLELEKERRISKRSIDSSGLYGTWAAAEEVGPRLRGCSGKNECVCHPGADSVRLFHLAGAVLGFWYDLIKTARKLIRHSHAAVSAEDLCYWIAAALYLFVRIYGENSGILRGYLFGGILGGAALYHASFGRFLPELLAKGIKKQGESSLFQENGW